MPDKALTDAAVEWIDRMHGFVDEREEPLADRALRMTHDFTFEDRRSP